MMERPSLWSRVDQTGVPLLAARLVVGITFVVMGANKISSPVEFLKLIRMFEMMPESPPYLLNATAVVLPWMEIVCGIALILGWYVRGSALLVALMLLVFTPAILLRALRIQADTGQAFTQIAFDCGCGTGVVVIWKKILSNLGLLALAALAIISGTRRLCLEGWLQRRQPQVA